MPMRTLNVENNTDIDASSKPLHGSRPNAWETEMCAGIDHFSSLGAKCSQELICLLSIPGFITSFFFNI